MGGTLVMVGWCCGGRIEVLGFRQRSHGSQKVQGAAEGTSDGKSTNGVATVGAGKKASVGMTRGGHKEVVGPSRVGKAGPMMVSVRSSGGRLRQAQGPAGAGNVGPAAVSAGAHSG